MTSSSLVVLLLLSILASWILFILFYSRIRRREASVNKRAEEIKKQLQEQITGIDAVLGLLTGIHELGFESADFETKPAIAKMIVDSACQIMKCTKGSLMLLDKANNELVIVAAKKIPDQAIASARLKTGEGVAGRVAETGKTIIVDDMDTDARFIRKKSAEYQSKSLISIPVQIRGRVIGVINVNADDAHHAFDERGIRLLTILASQSAITIENLDLYENFQKFYLEMVESLVHALELKENVKKTAGTRDQDRIFARKVAQKLDLPESIVRHIEFASLIHGIGKIGIDDAILKKPGKLTPDEYEQMKRHPLIGQEIIAGVEFLSPVTPIILYHQERWDGKGYPAGLVGEEIPLGSRIVSVINAYQAMTADRPYRKALSKAEAIEELKRGVGSQFDPKVVEAFIRVLEEEKGNDAGTAPRRTEPNHRTGDSGLA